MGRTVLANGAPVQANEGIYRPHATTTATGTVALNISSPTIQFIDPGGAGRTVTLPSEATSDGLDFLISNTGDALENLTVNDDAAATVEIIGPGQTVHLHCDGTSWKGPGSTRTSVQVTTLAGEGTIAATDPETHFIDPGGAGRDVLLPAEASSIGLRFFIFNTADAAEALTIKEDSDTTTIIVLDQDQHGIVVCNGTAWLGFIGSET